MDRVLGEFIKRKGAFKVDNQRNLAKDDFF